MIRDGKNSDPGSSLNIPDPEHWIPGFHEEKLFVDCGAAPAEQGAQAAASLQGRRRNLRGGFHRGEALRPGSVYQQVR